MFLLRYFNVLFVRTLPTYVHTLIALGTLLASSLASTQVSEERNKKGNNLRLQEFHSPDQHEEKKCNTTDQRAARTHLEIILRGAILALGFLCLRIVFCCGASSRVFSARHASAQAEVPDQKITTDGNGLEFKHQVDKCFLVRYEGEMQ